MSCYEDRADRAMVGWYFRSKQMEPELCVSACKGKVRAAMLLCVAAGDVRKAEREKGKEKRRNKER